ncbi:nicotinate (nicotinamide) nucleotide adenylyltransferase [Polynucleobacter sp. 15G-AUS-farblos]|uniref:nicotinate (nicotinamide) nucleotide adenylyltransferase n=1 Tax=Polynucleobacter sp. 15G-AUS-farblos TaxID=2689094 RepID=UPI001C0B059E|nr:nicotinate (nicotinamide) nucleotide adenylyltransferase [Polynucleobacter sp. 15G-AUS-farblos]
MSTIQKIGILGGTFDPPHNGHLKLAIHFARLLHLDELLLIPSGEPWQKGSGITPAEIRFQLTEAAGIDLTKALQYLKIPTQVGIDRIEIERAGPSYSIDTAKSLRERYGPETNLIWLTGVDSLIHLPSWNTWQNLFSYMNFAVASRPNYDLATEMSPEISKTLEKHQTLDLRALEITPYGLIYIDESLSVDLSSTDLRNRLKTSDRNLIESDQIPSHTLQIITKLGLYQ